MYVDRNVRLSTLIICRRRFLRCFPMDSSINREIAKMGKRLSETSDQSPSTYFEGELSWMTLNEYRRVLWKVPPVSDLKSYYQPCTNNMNAFLHNIILQSQHLDMSPSSSSASLCHGSSVISTAIFPSPSHDRYT